MWNSPLYCVCDCIFKQVTYYEHSDWALKNGRNWKKKIPKKNAWIFDEPLKPIIFLLYRKSQNRLDIYVNKTSKVDVNKLVAIIYNIRICLTHRKIPETPRNQKQFLLLSITTIHAIQISIQIVYLPQYVCKVQIIV